MRRFKKFIGVLFVVSVLSISGQADASIFINEILADPGAGLIGDANKDGAGSITQDEFVEILNYGTSSFNISGWSLFDALSLRHTFPNNSVIPAWHYLVVFGGGTPNLPGVLWQKATSGGLSLNNSAETVTLFDLSHTAVDKVVYGALAGHDQSIVRNPEAPSAAFVLHTSLAEAQGARFSPGTSTDGRTQHSAAVPEASTLIYLLSALGAMGIYRLKSRMPSNNF